MTPQELAQLNDKLDALTAMMRTGLDLAQWIVFLQVVKLVLDLIVLYIVVLVFNDVRSVIAIHNVKVGIIERKVDDVKVAATDAACRLEKKVEEAKEELKAKDDGGH